MSTATKNLAYVLLAAGFLGGAYVTALDIETVNWLWFGIAAVAAIGGVVLAKRADNAIATSGEMLANNRHKLNESLDNIVRELAQRARGHELRGEAMRDWIDDELRPDLRRFAEARKSLMHLYSLQVYADIMSEFAAGERYLNRVWSMTADGYDEEARVFLELAAAQFEDAQKALAAAGGGALQH